MSRSVSSRAYLSSMDYRRPESSSIESVCTWTKDFMAIAIWRILCGTTQRNFGTTRYSITESLRSSSPSTTAVIRRENPKWTHHRESGSP